MIHGSCGQKARAPFAVTLERSSHSSSPRIAERRPLLPLPTGPFTIVSRPRRARSDTLSSATTLLAAVNGSSSAAGSFGPAPSASSARPADGQ
eukprot:scaffold7890_cov315-Pinguiococcus_pyrenoidosus.AAC.2